MTEPAIGDIEPLLATFRALDPEARALQLAELAQIDPTQARLVVAALDAGEPATVRPQDETRRDNSDEPNDRFEVYLQRRAEMLEQLWRGRQFGPYEVTSILGQGGMGIVLGATDRETGKDVAIKMVRPDLLGPGLDLRLTRESAALSRLSHPGIAAFLGLGQTNDGRPFLVMERVDGKSLDRAGATLVLSGRMALLAQVCAVVAYAHGEQVVHRDLKPSNILVQDDGGVRLLDFGIAKCLADQAQMTRTLTAERMLTPRYAAPEQIRGEVAGPEADVHALGVMLVELALMPPPGSKPVVSVDATSDQDTTERPDPGKIGDPGLRAIAETALSANAADRYAHAGLMANDLYQWLSGRRPAVLGLQYRLRRRLRQGRTALLVTTMGLMVTLVLGSFAWREWVYLPRPIDAGHGVIERDLDGLSVSQKASVREAFRRDNSGERSNAIGLMKAVADGEGTNAVAPLFLSVWLSVRSGEEADRYRKEALKRLSVDGNPYLSLFLDAYDETDDEAALRRAMESALALRPFAWKFRFALAHQAISQNNATRAREELAKIEFTAFEDRRVPQVLADRALLGDCAEVRPLIPKLPEDRPLWRIWVSAACDFSEGNHDTARLGFNRILEDPASEREPSTRDVVRSAQLLSLGEESRWMELLDAAALGWRRSLELKDRFSAHRDALMAVTAARQLGMTEDIDLWRNRALSVEEFEYQVDAHLTIRLLGLPSRFEVAAMRADAARNMPEFPGLGYLIEAVELQQAGQGEAALAALARARREGLGETRFAPTLLALERSLGRPQIDEGVMLWFAPWTDWVARWVLPVARRAPSNHDAPDVSD